MKWVDVAAASDQLTAEMWRDALISEGIPAMVRPGDAVSFLGVSSMPCRIMVPEGMLEEAKAIVADLQ
ncbi:MAG: DUF2007 domain-containing protein [Chloroflexota bacterium]